MFYKKKGLPEEGEVVICTVKKILYHSIFASIDEYENKEGMLNISEVSPGRIRNIRDFVKEDKQVVCKVLRVNKENNHIDLSLRRVNNSQRVNKLREFKKEIKAEKILELIGKETSKDLATAYKEIGEKLIDEYGSLNNAFENFSLDDELIDSLSFNKKTVEIIKKIVSAKIKKPEVEIKEVIELKSEKENGIEIVKNILTKLQKGDIRINYISAPRYRIAITASDYKTAEGVLDQLNNDAKKLADENGVLFSFSRIK